MLLHYEKFSVIEDSSWDDGWQLMPCVLFCVALVIKINIGKENTRLACHFGKWRRDSNWHHLLGMAKPVGPTLLRRNLWVAEKFLILAILADRRDLYRKGCHFLLTFVSLLSCTVYIVEENSLFNFFQTIISDVTNYLQFETDINLNSIS